MNSPQEFIAANQAAETVQLTFKKFEITACTKKIYTSICRNKLEKAVRHLISLSKFTFYCRRAVIYLAILYTRYTIDMNVAIIHKLLS